MTFINKPRRRWIVVSVLSLLVSGCSGSIPILVAEHREHPITNHEMIQQVEVGQVALAGGHTKFKERKGWIGSDQVALIGSILPIYQAVAGSAFFQSKGSRVVMLVLDERNKTLQFLLRNSEYFTVLYTPVRVDALSANAKFVRTAAGDFQIRERGVWLPGDR